MARWRTTSAAALALALAGPAPAAEPTALLEIDFALHGEPVAASREALEGIAPATLRVHEPYEDREIPFRALPLRPLLEAVYGARLDEADEVLFTCRDGYQPTVPLARFLAHDAYLAIARADGRDFAIDKLESGRRQRVPLGPYYAIWDNLGSEALRRDHDYGWPYQVVGIDLIRAAERFPAMAPPEGAGREVVAGFRDFRVHCSRCHRVNGEGGSVGPELNAREIPAGAADPAWLRRWIDDPARIAASSRMPALNPALPDRAETIDRIVSYLQAIAQEGPR